MLHQEFPATNIKHNRIKLCPKIIPQKKKWRPQFEAATGLETLQILEDELSVNLNQSACHAGALESSVGRGWLNCKAADLSKVAIGDVVEGSLPIRMVEDVEERPAHFEFRALGDFESLRKLHVCIEVTGSPEEVSWDVTEPRLAERLAIEIRCSEQRRRRVRVVRDAVVRRTRASVIVAGVRAAIDASATVIGC